MGCDIRTAVIKKLPDGKLKVVADYLDNLFQDNRSYDIFGFLAGVRNYVAVSPIAANRQLPEDIKKLVYHSELRTGFYGYEYLGDINYGILGDTSELHSITWVNVEELIKFDYSQKFENRRNNGDTLPIGQGRITTYREFLGKCYFDFLSYILAYGEPEDLILIMGFEG